MGIRWSNPRPVADASSIMITSEFPSGDIQKAKIWNLWRAYKTELKSDGFNIRKHLDKWQISWFHTVTETSFVKISNEPKYMTIFKEVYNEWFEVYEDVNTAGFKKEEPEETDWFLPDSDKSYSF